MTDFEILDVWMRKNEDDLFHSNINHDQIDRGIRLFDLTGFEKAYEKSQSKLLFGKTILLSSDLYEIEPFEGKTTVQEIKDELNKRIDAHNENIQEIDFSEPWILYVYFAHEGVTVSYSAYNERYEGIESSEEALERIESEVYEIYDEKKIQEIRLKLNKKADDDLLVVTESMLVDKEFHSCTNHELRMQYMKRLLVKYPEYKSKISAAGYYKASTYADYVWKLYKESKKN